MTELFSLMVSTISSFFFGGGGCGEGGGRGCLLHRDILSTYTEDLMVIEIPCALERVANKLRINYTVCASLLGDELCEAQTDRHIACPLLACTGRLSAFQRQCKCATRVQ